MARKKSRQTFEKAKREQAVKERRARKQERKGAARLAKAAAADGVHDASGEEPEEHVAPAERAPTPASAHGAPANE